MDELTRRRLFHNEQLFRDVNQERDRTNPDAGDRPLGLVCECSDLRCTGRITMPASRYEGIRRSGDRYIVLPGHETAEIEDVVERGDAFEIIEKHAA
jgi:hypothetical protein